MLYRGLIVRADQSARQFEAELIDDRTVEGESPEAAKLQLQIAADSLQGALRRAAPAKSADRRANLAYVFLGEVAQADRPDGT